MGGCGVAGEGDARTCARCRLGDRDGVLPCLARVGGDGALLGLPDGLLDELESTFARGERQPPLPGLLTGSLTDSLAGFLAGSLTGLGFRGVTLASSVAASSPILVE